MKKEQVLEVVEWLKSTGYPQNAENVLKVCEDHFKLKACEPESSLKVRLAAALWGRPVEDVDKRAAFAIEFIFREIEVELSYQKSLLVLDGEFAEGFQRAAEIVSQLGASVEPAKIPGSSTRERFMWLKARERAKATGRSTSTEEVFADIKSTMKELFDPNKITYLWVCSNESHYAVADMRRDPPWPELKLAAEIAGKSYISGPFEMYGGNQRYEFHGKPHEVVAFKEHWAPKAGLVLIQGDPETGSARGYIRES